MSARYIRDGDWDGPPEPEWKAGGMPRQVLEPEDAAGEAGKLWIVWVLIWSTRASAISSSGEFSCDS